MAWFGAQQRRGNVLAMIAIALLLNLKFVHPARYSRIVVAEGHDSWEKDTIRETEDWVEENASQIKSSSQTLEADATAAGNASLHRQVAGAPTYVVDQGGGGHFRSVQAAVNAVPDNNRVWIVIQIKAGLYK